jgi:subtilisin family serine protease
MSSDPRPDSLAGSGAGVRVAIIDSGVHVDHPHVGASIAGGVGIDAHGLTSDDFIDRLGHGTAVAAAIHEKAPGARLHAVRIFGGALATNITTLVAAIDWAIAARMHLVNLSLGTSQAGHEPRLRAAVERATAAGVLLVAASDDGGMRWLPGSLPGVLPVLADATCPRDTFRVEHRAGAAVFCASPFPRPIPGVPPEKNLSGISFAVANMTGFVARVLTPGTPRQALADVVAALCAGDATQERFVISLKKRSSATVCQE